MYNGIETVTLDFEILKRYDFLREIIDYYNKYIELLNKLQVVLKNNGFEYSLHSQQSIIFHNISEIENVINSLNSLIAQISSYVKNEMEGL